MLTFVRVLYLYPYLRDFLSAFCIDFTFPTTIAQNLAPSTNERECGAGLKVLLALGQSLYSFDKVAPKEMCLDCYGCRKCKYYAFYFFTASRHCACFASKSQDKQDKQDKRSVVSLVMTERTHPYKKSLILTKSHKITAKSHKI